jgi:hypothetical protein
MAMTSYAWPAHLCFNLVFLWFYTSRGGCLPWVAPWVGLLAVGLHQPHVHPLFAAPFVLRLALDRRWRMFAWYSGVYALAAGIWWLWLQHTRFSVPGGNLAGTFGLPGARMIPVHLTNAGLLLSWNTPLLAVLVALAVWHWRRLPAFARDLALSATLTLGFYVFFPHNQGHGWGYRFAHGLLGSFALLAVYGWGFASEIAGAPLLRRVVWGSLAFTVLFQVPARLFEVASFVRPYARSWRLITSQPADIVVIDAATGWYAADLVRNDPFFESGPKVMFLHRLNSPALVEELQRRGRIAVVNYKHLEPLGLPQGIPRIPMPVASGPGPQPASTGP